MQGSDRRRFVKFLLALMVAQAGLIFVAWLSLPWGVNMWIRNKGLDLERTAQGLSGQFSWQEVCAVPPGETKSPAFMELLTRLRAQEKARFPHREATLALFAVMPGEPRKWLSIRVADYQEYEPDDGKPPSSELNVDRQAIQKVISGQTSSSAEPWVGDGGTAPQISGYAPLKDSDGSVKAVLAVDLSSASLEILNEVARFAFLLSVVAALVVSLLGASVLASKFVEPMTFLREVNEAALLARQDIEAEAKMSAVLTGRSEDRTPPSQQESLGTESEPDRNEWNQLTNREREIALLVGRGWTNKEIAEKLTVAEGTVT